MSNELFPEGKLVLDTIKNLLIVLLRLIQKELRFLLKARVVHVATNLSPYVTIVVAQLERFRCRLKNHLRACLKTPLLT